MTPFVALSRIVGDESDEDELHTLIHQGGEQNLGTEFVGGR
ncbi:Uncharacterised protein [Nocardia otitidiscaviarum]|uniref:Uncharacterized protein n=2 Tax=Nocardia otitidiscaviarum TaxID=1823 RepID=A0A379JLW3_9NOCA|nr:Uncharacterised protein [Nocardia otitidiscaviarum]